MGPNQSTWDPDFSVLLHFLGSLYRDGDEPAWELDWIGGLEPLPTVRTSSMMIAEKSPTRALLRFASQLHWRELEAPVRRAALRHCLDSFGAIIAGSSGDLCQRVGSVLTNAGDTLIPGFGRRFSYLDGAYMAGIAGHGLELDDGYRLGSVHLGVAVLPALIAASQMVPVPGTRFLASMVVGYETIAAIARGCHPTLRRRGFHPTGVVGVFGAAMAIVKLLQLSEEQTQDALGLAASSSGGLFAFLGGGADVKRLHAGHAAREGLAAALLARSGVRGPPNILECTDGFAQAFAQPDSGSNIQFPPKAEFGILDCYIKPYPCCRHLQPALQALIELLQQHDLVASEVERIEVDTYNIAAAHANTGWADFASAQLSFPYILSLGLHERDVQLRHFHVQTRSDSRHDAVRAMLKITASAQMDARYPKERPARVTLHTRRGTFSHFVGEAPGSREFPLTQAEVARKFTDLVESVLDRVNAQRTLEGLLQLESASNVSRLFSAMTPSHS